jgi:hypothetical protein
MTFVERCKSIESRCDAIEHLRNSSDEAIRLSKLLEDLRKRTESLEPIIKRTKLMRSAGLSVSAPTNLADAKKRATAIAEKFSSAHEAKALTSGTQWRVFLEALERVASECGKGLYQSWKQYIHSVYSGQAPDKVSSSLAMTTSNRTALNEYRKHYEELTKLERTLPDHVDSVQRVNQIAEALRIAYRRFDFNVPNSVRAFLNATIEADGASLRLLTPEVVKWLEANNLIEKFSVKGRMSSGFVQFG